MTEKTKRIIGDAFGILAGAALFGGVSHSWEVAGYWSLTMFLIQRVHNRRLHGTWF